MGMERLHIGNIVLHIGNIENIVIIENIANIVKQCKNLYICIYT